MTNEIETTPTNCYEIHIIVNGIRVGRLDLTWPLPGPNGLPGLFLYPVCTRFTQLVKLKIKRLPTQLTVLHIKPIDFNELHDLLHFYPHANFAKSSIKTNKPGRSTNPVKD